MTALGETTYTLAAVSDAYEAMGKLAKENPDSHRYRYERGRAAGQLGEVYRDLGNFEKAMACFEEFRAAATEAHAAAPESDDIAQQLAQSHMRIGAMLRAMGQAEKAIPEYAEAIRITGMMLERSPSTDLYRSHSSANSGMFITYCDLNRVREGIAYAQASIEASEKAYALSPSDTDVIRELAVSYSDLGYGYYLLNGHEQAIPPYQRASELSNLVAARDPLNLVWAREAAIAETFLADGLDSAGRTAEAQETYRRTVQRLRDIVLRDPTNQKYRMDLAIALTRVGRAATTLAQFEEAITSLREAAGLIEALALETPDSVQYRFAQAATMEFIGDAYHSDGRPEEAFAAYDRARAIKVGIAEASPAIGRYWSDAASSARLMLAVASKNAMPDKAAEAARYQLEYSLRSAEAPDPESTAPTLVARAAAELAMALDQLQPVPADERAQAVRKGLEVAEATGLQRPSELSFYALLLLLDGREAEAEPMLRRLLDSGYDPGQFWLYPPTRDWLERNGLTPPEPKGPDGTSGPAE
jgi:tetratricopeptide (TPR) repeat protein